MLKGTVAAITPDGKHEVRSGGGVLFPRGLAHTFTNRTDVPLRFPSVASGGLDRFVVELRQAEDEAAQRAVLDDYDTEPVF